MCLCFSNLHLCLGHKNSVLLAESCPSECWLSMWAELMVFSDKDSCSAIGASRMSLRCKKNCVVAL